MQLPPKSGNFQLHLKFQQSFIYSVHANIRLLDYAFFSILSVPKGLHSLLFSFFTDLSFFANEQERAKTVLAIFWNTSGLAL